LSNNIYAIDASTIDLCLSVFGNQKEAFFVIRAKSNTSYYRLYSHKVDKTTGVKFDQTIRLKTPKSSIDYPINYIVK
jgi:rRNA processing protein Gar1